MNVVYRPRGSQVAIGRRTFLAAAAGAPLLAAAALLANRPQPPTATPAASADVPGTRGYHETEHIRKYYSTATF